MTERRQTPNRARDVQSKEERRMTILASALGLFEAASYDEVTMTAVARSAGIAKGTLYLYFTTREEVLLALYMERLCDWGVEFPTGARKAPYFGDTAPIWINPAQGLFLLLGLLALLIFIILVIVISAATEFQGDCRLGTIFLRNLLLFYFFFVGSMLLYIARTKYMTDKMWSRYLIQLGVLNLLAAGNSVGLFIYMMAEDSSCEDDDSASYGTSIALFLISLIIIGLSTILLIYTVVKLYCQSEAPLAHNDPDYLAPVTL